MMARPSRLDRLLGLLRTGPSEAARLAAGRQLGAIQREHPEQLHALLQRVLCYLFHEEWETRRAAAHALEEIAEAVTTWQPSHPDAASAEVEAAARDEASGAWLSFESFAIDRVLAHGAPLLASGGQEFEANDAADDRPHERLLRQRALLQEQLGLDAIGSAIGGREQREMMDLIKEDDVLGAGRAAAASHRAAAADAHQLAAARLIAEELAASGGALSERARNTLKRKARRAAKLATDGGADGVVVQLPMAKRRGGSSQRQHQRHAQQPRMGRPAARRSRLRLPTTKAKRRELKVLLHWLPSKLRQGMIRRAMRWRLWTMRRRGRGATSGHSSRCVLSCAAHSSSHVGSADTALRWGCAPCCARMRPRRVRWGACPHGCATSCVRSGCRTAPSGSSVYSLSIGLGIGPLVIRSSHPFARRQRKRSRCCSSR